MRERVGMQKLYGKMTDAGSAAGLIRDGMTVAMSGYAMAGYPKAVPRELARRAEAGERLRLHLVTGANVPYLDELLAAAGALGRRAPMCAGRTLSGQINGGRVRYAEQQMSRMPRLLRSGSFGRLDVAVVEALEITGEGHIVPTTSVGMAQHLLEHAERVIVEVNTAQPGYLRGLHDVYTPAPPPHTRPIPLTAAGQRIGEGFFRVPPDKIAAIVMNDQPERVADTVFSDSPAHAAIAAHLFAFLEQEYGRSLPPLQTGFGGLADSVTAALGAARFDPVALFCGGAGQAAVELLWAEKASVLSAGGVALSVKADELLAQMPSLSQRLILRSGDVANSAETVGRLGLVALNTGIEVDIYGNLNASHIGGSRVVNGIGGGAYFAQNAGLSVVLMPSTGRGGDISAIVPMVSHQDIGEHDVDVLVTEHGAADLRGLDDRERAGRIIDRCAAGGYREMLRDYYGRAARQCGGHHPQLPEEAFAWHRRLRETGSMRER